VKEHEDKHHDDVDCSGDGLERPGWKKGKSPKISEGAAAMTERQCLKKCKKECEGDPRCEDEIDERLDQLKGYGWKTHGWMQRRG
jgi:hypothetical protein